MSIAIVLRMHGAEVGVWILLAIDYHPTGCVPMLPRLIPHTLTSIQSVLFNDDNNWSRFLFLSLHHCVKRMWLFYVSVYKRLCLVSSFVASCCCVGVRMSESWKLVRRLIECNVQFERTMIMRPFLLFTVQKTKKPKWKKKIANSTIYPIEEHALHAHNFLNAITSLFCLNLRIKDIRLFLVLQTHTHNNGIAIQADSFFLICSSVDAVIARISHLAWECVCFVRLVFDTAVSDGSSPPSPPLPHYSKGGNFYHFGVRVLTSRMRDSNFE